MRKTHALPLFLLLGLGLVACNESHRSIAPLPARELEGGEARPVARRETPRTPNQQVDVLARDELAAELLAHPVTATWLGVHRYDDRLDDVRADAQTREATRLRGLLGELAHIDDSRLDAQHRIDRLLLERRAEDRLLDLTELKPLERNPIRYVELTSVAIEQLIGGQFEPLPERLRAIVARLWKIRPLLDDARRNLRPTAPELTVKKALELLQSEKGFFTEILPRAVQSVPDAKLMDEFRSADADAVHAVDDFSTWLQKDLLPHAHGDFALGRVRFAEKLRDAEGVELQPEQLVAAGERAIKRERARYDQAAHELTGGRPGVDPLRMVEDDHGKADDLQIDAQTTLESIVAFMRGQKILTLPEPARPKVVEMPPALWGYAQLELAGPLDDRPGEAHLYIDPIDKSWPDKRKLEHLRYFNRAQMVMRLLHAEVGHYVQEQLDRHAPTVMQKVALSLGFMEGWAFYGEQMMLDQGFDPGDARVRLVVARAAMLRDARLVAAVRLHALGAKLDDAAKIFSVEALLDDYTARREAERTALDPMVLDEALGQLEIEKLRDDWRAVHPDAPLGAFHDAMLRHGSPPVTVLRQILLPGDTGKSPL